MISLLLASAIADSAETASVTITDLDRTTTTLGRRGQRVTESWQVVVGGKTSTVEFFPYHTRTANTPGFLSEGDTVELRLSLNEKTALMSGEKIRLAISAVKK